jgi:hypothetical protein
MKKATSPNSVKFFEQIPNVGKEIAKDFVLLGLKTPEELISQNAFDLYIRLCQRTKSYHDPCVLDTFLAVVEFMNGKSNKKWWDFSEKRKQDFGKVAHLVEKWKI